MNSQVVYLSSNPDSGDLILQLIYSEAGTYRTGWSRYLKDFYTEGWEWSERGEWPSIPIGVKGLIQW